MTTNDISLRLMRSRTRQAQEYSTLRSQIAQHAVDAKSRPITLPTVRCVYGNRLVTYQNGRLMAGSEVVRVREGAQFIEVQL